MTWKRVDGLRTIEFGAVGESRSKILHFLLNGNKRATAGLLEHDYQAEGEPIETVGEILVVLDNDFKEVGRIRVTKVDLTTFGQVPDEFAIAEAEGDLNAEDFRQSHQAFWSRAGYDVSNETQIVLVYFDLL